MEDYPEAALTFRIIRRLGVVPLALVGPITSAFFGRVRQHGNWSVQGLEARRLVKRVNLSELELPRAPGLGPFVVATPSFGWHQWVSAPAPHINIDCSRREIVEAAVLSSEVIRRMAVGYKLSIRDESLSERAETEVGGGDADLPGELRRRPALDHGALPMLLDPGTSRRAALVLGTGWGDQNRISSYIRATRAVVPVEVLCYDRSLEYQQYLRAAMDRAACDWLSRSPRTASSDVKLTALPNSRGSDWRPHWQVLIDDVNAVDPVQLRLRLEPLFETSATDAG